MESSFDNTDLPIWCERCNQQGYIFVDDPELPYFVVCKTCGLETSEVWCPDCKMGGEFVRNISKRPSYWVCPNCKTKYQLPDSFYENSISLYPVEELPDEARQKIDNEHSLGKKQQFYAAMVIFFGLALLIVPWILMANSINYLPVQMRLLGVPIVLIFGVFWLFCWKHILKLLKNKVAQWSLSNHKK